VKLIQTGQGGSRQCVDKVARKQKEAFMSDRQGKANDVKFVWIDTEMFINRASITGLLKTDEITCLRGNEKVTANYIRKLIDRLEKIKPFC
jgi:hypothetical protein